MPSSNTKKKKKKKKSGSRTVKNKLRFQPLKKNNKVERNFALMQQMYTCHNKHTHWLLQACTHNAEIYLTAELQ